MVVEIIIKPRELKEEPIGNNIVKRDSVTR